MINNSIKLLSFDIDNTLIELQTIEGGFSMIWEEYQPDQEILLTYNTGRLYPDVLSLIGQKIIPEADYIIGGVGTHIYNCREKVVLKEFSEILEEGWDVLKVEEIVQKLHFNILPQPKKYQHSYKRSYFFEEASPEDIIEIERIFNESDLDINVVYSGDKYLDILPKWANKGNALDWLLKNLNLSTQQVIVAGDSGNDIAMFELGDIHGIVVGNARDELYKTTKYRKVYHAERPRYQGVVEGLVFYGVFPEVAVLNLTKMPNPSSGHFLQQHNGREVTGSPGEKIDIIREGYNEALRALKLNVSSMGFLACPTDHNIAGGTDVNYHSVWARDGAITIIGALPLIHDEVIHQTIRQTFVTLLEHISPNGQIPSNVRLSDQQADYSGVGGICSIDSGLWLLIALYEYINVSDDLEFLKEHIFELQRVMNWLSAHDGNNDALLEIPEAGDWTDLFGRSYHVLYDEILWYRTNVCFGRMMEMLGNYEKAGDYIRWSQVIKKEILANFWPSSRQTVSFTEKQFSLGDTKYLLAQITPFDFSWRMDSLGNILAFLYNVVDAEKALETLRFIVGVGMNEPFPISNVYPVVSPGDPDWRPYYTVNLLNLPHHYHNGGIWPFVGALWVQFVSKLGLSEMALDELYKLAKLNKSGIYGEWEFNEWAHGKTGRPMGKVYQAWSAAQYIAACHQLKIGLKE